MRLGDIGEKGFIKNIIESFKKIWVWGPLEPGDDAVAIPYVGGYLILKIDGFSAYNSKYPWNTWRDFGWKAATACVSDIVSKGGRPSAYMVSLGLKPDMSIDEGLDIMRGVAEAVEVYGGYLAGGDTNSAEKDIWIDVACIGFTPVDPVRRGGMPGDHIVITGGYGLQALAYRYYLKYLRNEVELRDIPESIIRATSRPRARIEAHEIIIRFRDCIRGCVDVSDSLAESLYLMSEASGHVIELSEIPIDPEALEISRRLGLDPIEQALYGGEEFELVISADPSCSSDLVKELRRSGVSAEIYGIVSEKRGLEVYHKKKIIERRGFQHF
ncbi:MAG: thiamine-phosphate kinase [Sulfolobales archaeon]